jgi:DNA polymerase-3 subunit epsilon
MKMQIPAGFNFVAIDFETGMYRPNSAVSIGLVKFKEAKPVDGLYTLLRPPQLYIRPDFTSIHGITVEDVEDAPRFNEIWESRILPFIERLPLCAHNAGFDMKVLAATLEYYGLPKPELHYFDTLKLARKTWPGLESHALPALAEYFGIEYAAHNALEDAETCGRIVSLAADTLEVENLQELLHKTSQRMGRC